MTFTFKCDSTSLDFIGTLKFRQRQDPTELLPSPEDAALWFQEAGIVDDVLAFTDEDMASAVELREAVWAVVASHVSGSELPQAALATVNAVAATPTPTPQLTTDGRRVSATPNQAMSAIARDAIEIF